MAGSREGTKRTVGDCCRRGGSGDAGEVVGVAEEEGKAVGVGRGSLSEEENVEMSWPLGRKRECEEEGNGVIEKRLKKDVDVEEEEEVYDIDGRYGEYLYDKWMWESMRENRFAFPSVSMWYWLTILKERLWQRYNIFYDADAIGEVYPENEIAEWVWEACHAKREPHVVWRDRELSFEWTNDWCGRQAPREIRSYEEEVAVQARRRNYREGMFAWNTGKGIEMPRRPRVMRLTSEEEIRFLEEKERFWRRRRVPCKAQHDAEEPNHVKWDALQQGRKENVIVSEKINSGEGKWLNEEGSMKQNK